MKKLRLLFSAIVAVMLLSCTQEKKSELVQRLEKIFYSDSFSLISESTFNVADYGAIAD